MSKKWTKWIHNGDPDVFPYKKEVVQVQTLPDGSIRYKRLKKNVEAEERENELDTTFLSGVVEGLNRNDPELQHPETPEQPEAIITGPGEYRMHNGEKATIVSPRQCSWVGRIVKHDREYPCEWRLDGACIGRKSPYDITGPWVEDEPKPEEPEMWVNVFDYIGGTDCSGTYSTEKKAVDAGRSSSCAGNYIGTFKLVKVDDSPLSHTVEEGE